MNGWVTPSDAARAVGRFRPDGPVGYRAASNPDGPLRVTRAEATHDEMATRTASCPRCGLSPAYRRVPADPWDHHEVCIDCGWCYLHDTTTA